jgi:alanine racemase
MIRPTVARVDLAALTSNYRAIVEHLQEGPPRPPEAGRDASARRNAPGVIAVVKANAYGHGAGQIALALENAGADLLACADIEEGAALRAAGVRAEILVFGALSVSDLDGLFDCALTPTISTPGAAHAVQAAAARYKRTLRYHLKIDTGMNRLGFRFDNLRWTLPALLASPNLELAAAYTHFATADDPESPLFSEQRMRFERALAEIDAISAGAIPRVTPGGSSRPERSPYIHAANSAALLRDSRVWYDRVRPGLLLYGVVPPPLASTIRLTPVITLVSRVVAVKGVRPGEGAGYGVRFTADTPAQIAIVPAGYADGLDLRLAGCGAVLIRGRRAPIVGSICMDMLIADVNYDGSFDKKEVAAFSNLFEIKDKDRNTVQYRNYIFPWPYRLAVLPVSEWKSSAAFEPKSDGDPPLPTGTTSNEKTPQK